MRSECEKCPFALQNHQEYYTHAPTPPHSSSADSNSNSNQNTGYFQMPNQFE